MESKATLLSICTRAYCAQQMKRHRRWRRFNNEWYTQNGCIRLFYIVLRSVQLCTRKLAFYKMCSTLSTYCMQHNGSWQITVSPLEKELFLSSILCRMEWIDASREMETTVLVHSCRRYIVIFFCSFSFLFVRNKSSTFIFSTCDPLECCYWIRSRLLNVECHSGWKMRLVKTSTRHRHRRDEWNSKRSEFCV